MLHAYVAPRAAARFAATAAFVAMAAIAGAAAQSPGTVLAIAIYPDHYVLAGAATGDLDLLARAVAARRPQVVRLDACGPDAERLQRAAAHRFRHFVLMLRRLEPDTADCRAAIVLPAVSALRRGRQEPSNIDDDAVDRWWHRSMP